MESTIIKIIGKIERDGFISLLVNGPIWLLRRTKLAKQLRRYQLRARYATATDTANTFYINPSSINFHLLKSRYTRRDCGEIGRFHHKYHSKLILPGKWDVYKDPIESELIYRAYRRHFKDGLSWDRTEYGSQIHRIYQRGGTRKGYSTVEDYFRSREKLYEKIRNEGYNSRFGRININIGRNGELISNNDVRHRLAICKLSGIEQVPVEVIVRHKGWQKIRKEITKTDSITESATKETALADHPDISTN